MKQTIAIWFSNGAASAVAAKFTIDKYAEDNNILIVNNPVLEEHHDNLRFKKDISDWLQYPISEAKCKEYPSASIVDVFDKRRYMSGPLGAPCTMLLKRQARYEFELDHEIDYHVLGFTLDEKQRSDRFIKSERGNVIPVLINAGITKQECFNVLGRAGIKLPEIYSLRYPNANCIGCVKATSPSYWNLVRETFPEVFAARAEQSRRIGCRLVRRKGKRIFLDELLATDKGGKIRSYECSIFCNEK